MGHIRLGRLPKTYKWRDVFDVLDDDNLTGEILANAISRSAQEEFESLKGDQSLSFCFWILAYIVSSAKSDSFLNRLEKLGINTKNIDSGLDFAKSFSSYISQSLNEMGRPNAFTNIAELSLNETITKILVNQTKTLFGTKIDDIQVACKKTATKKQFGLISRQFFATFLTRSLQFVTDKEVSNYIGRNKSISSSNDLISLQKALSTFCYQSSKIVEEFSGGWFSKQSWQTKNDISYDSAKGFMAYAIEKVNMGLRGETA